MIKSIFFTLLLLTFASAEGQSPMVALGRSERIEFESAYIGKRNVDVWLPPGYDTTKVYKVLYMHDGQMLFDSTHTWNHKEWKLDEVAGALMQNGSVSSFVIVGIWNNGDQRPYEFYPQKALGYLDTTKRDSLQKTMKYEVTSDAYLTFIIKELKPFIESKYHVSGRKEDVTIGGASRGGIISLYALCEYPEVFGNAICMSTHWIGGVIQKDPLLAEATMNYFESHIPTKKGHRIYFDHGTLGLDAEYHDKQVELNKRFGRRGWFRGDHFLFAVYPGEDHHEIAWSKRVDVPLKWIYSPK